jgi:Fe-S-cluster containining protein
VTVVAARLADNRQWILDKVRKTADVPCGSCTACCRVSAIFLHPEAGDNPALYQTVEAFDAYWGGMRRMLARRPDGACLYLDDAKGCTIHARRPAACRAYSCVEQYRMYSRADRRRLKREDKWGPVQEAGERLALIEDGKRVA